MRGERACVLGEILRGSMYMAAMYCLCPGSALGVPWGCWVCCFVSGDTGGGGVVAAAGSLQVPAAK